MLALIVASILVPAQAQDDWDTGLDTAPPPIVGGAAAPANKWNDTVSLDMGCTGTLIGPRTVLTAAHCVGNVRSVHIGTTDWTDNSQGEVIQVSSQTPHPDYRGFGNDIALLTLASASTYPPRAISQGCTQESIVDGATTYAVGFGSTRNDGGGFNALLNEVTVLVTDANCDGTQGCDFNAPANSEIVAGGGGLDSCNGDSGGPLYLQTPYGIVLLGVTSRPHYETNRACGDGGVYTRADHYLPWIQQTSGGDVTLVPSCNEAPVIAAVPFDPIKKNKKGSTTFTITDPDSESWTTDFPIQPLNGALSMKDESTIVYTPVKGFVGEDSFVLQVTDNHGGSSSVTLPIAVTEGGCGCANGGPSAMWSLGLVGLLGLRRRTQR